MRFTRFFCLFFIPLVAIGQQKKFDCGCPASKFGNTKADTVFRLRHDKSIALCGSEEQDVIKGKKLYSEFVLSVCGSNNIIKFWGAVLVCNVKTSGDTLLVERIENLPVGRSMKYRQTVWTTEHIYFKNGKIFRDSVINQRLPRYAPQQISAVLNLYHHLPNVNTDATSDLADKLLISSFSGSKEALSYLENFRQKFSTLDGVYLEDYDRTMEMLKGLAKTE